MNSSRSVAGGDIDSASDQSSAGSRGAREGWHDRLPTRGSKPADPAPGEVLDGPSTNDSVVDPSSAAGPAATDSDAGPSGKQAPTRLRVTLIAPTLNEIDAVRIILPQIDRACLEEIIVVDGGSTDGTVEFCRELGIEVYRQKDRGYGSALREAIDVARGDVIMEFQPDGNSRPDMVPLMIAELEKGYDLVVGSRYMPGATSFDDDKLTRIGNWVFTRLVNLFFRARYTDVLIGFRIFRRDAYRTLGIDTRGLSWAIQLPIRFAKRGFRISEIPADEPKRIGGQRKMRPFKHGTEFLLVLFKEIFTR